MVDFRQNGNESHVIINGKVYETGLIWETYNGDDNADLQAKNRANDLDADLYCINDESSQFGFGSTHVGHHAKFPSLAINIQENITGDFLAVFNLDENENTDDEDGRYYILAIFNGKILASTDCVIYDYQELLNTTTEIFYSSGANWKHVIAPEKLGLEESVYQPIEQFLKIPTKNRLKPTVVKGNKKRFLLLGAILILFGGGYYAYNYHQNILKNNEVMENLKKDNLKKQKEMMEARKLHIPAWPWENIPNGLPLAEYCEKEILKIPADYSGWTATEMSCDGKKIDVLLKRNQGTINWLSENIKYLNRPYNLKLNNKGEGVVSFPIDIDKNISLYNRQSKGGDLNAEKIYLTQHFEELFEPITLKQSPGNPVQAVIDIKGTTQAIYLYKQMDIFFSTKNNINFYNNIFKNISLLTLSSVTLDISSWTWNINMRSYEKIPIPANIMVADDTPNTSKKISPELIRQRIMEHNKQLAKNKGE
jgi:hypothetical protein